MSAPAPAGGEAIASSDVVLDVSLSTAWHDTLALALARSHHLTSYDAAYLELALRRGLPLASRDKALQAAARLEGVPLLPC
jgi:predicted nucleic acid-binding protein